MAYQSVTHVAIRVTGLREAERYYRTIFGLQVAFRQAEVADGWRTLPVGAKWASLKPPTGEEARYGPTTPLDGPWRGES